MKNILFLSILLINFIQADMVGIKSKIWTSVPTGIYNESKTVAMLEESSNSNQHTQNEWITNSETTYDEGEKTAQEVASLPLATLEKKSDEYIDESTFIQEAPVETTQPVDNLPLATIVSNDVVSNEPISTDTYVVETPSIQKPKIESKKSITEQEVEAIIKKAHASDYTAQSSSIVESSEITPIDSATVETQTLENSSDDNSLTESTLSDYVDSLITFIQENILLAFYFLALSFIFLYLFVAKPWSSSKSDMVDVNELNSYEEDFEIPQLKKEAIVSDEKESFKDEPQTHLEDKSFLTQNQYSILYGLINETFIYEKEKILLAENKTQDRKNRESISLEWKFNQILHFLLPKLATDNSREFVHGVKELIINEYTRDIMRVVLKDILENKSIKESDKALIQKELDYYENKKLNNYEARKERLVSSSY